MRITHVISGLTKGGAERVVVELANIAVEKGHEVTVLAAWPVDPAMMQDQLHPGVGIKFIGATRKKAYLNLIPWIFRNRKWIGSNDVLHCHLTYGAVFGTFVFVVLRKIFRYKKPAVVETNHAVGMPIPPFNRWVHSRMLLFRDGVVFMARDAYWNGFMDKHPGLRSALIVNGIRIPKQDSSAEQHQQFRQKMGVKENCRYLVGTVSMLRPERKPWLYISLLQDVMEAMGDDVQFILAGDGVERDALRAQIEEKDLSDRICMPGLVNNPTSVMSNLDIYVSLCAGETAGISMIEAAMCGIPVVGIQLDPAYTPKETDWVWSNADIHAVAKKIISLLQDTGERKQVAHMQQAHVNQYFTTEAMYTSYDAFYKTVS